VFFTKAELNYSNRKYTIDDGMTRGSKWRNCCEYSTAASIALTGSVSIFHPLYMLFYEQIKHIVK